MSSIEVNTGNARETSNTGRGDNPLKRKLVDPVNPEQEVPSSKRQNVTLNEDLQHKVLRWIANCHLRIRYTLVMKQFEPTARHICLGDQVHNILCTAHQYLKQTNSHFKISLEEYRVTVRRTSFTAKTDDIHMIILEEAGIEGLKYKTYQHKDVDNWYRVAEQCLDLFTGFALRTKELMLGHDMIRVLSYGTLVAGIPTSQYGIERAHEILLEGITFPPQKKSSMAQSMGPLTLLLAHIRSQKTHAEKCANAAKRALAHVPEIDHILAVTQGRPAHEVMPLVGEIANLLFLINGRQAIRMFFSPTCFYYLCSRRTIGSLALIADLQGHSLGPDNVKHVSSSGAGGFAFYKLMTLCKWEYEGDLTASQAAQVFFHGTFGTYKEDFGLLQSITNQATWQTRECMRAALQKKNSRKYVQFLPIKLIRCYNISWVNQFKFLTETKQQITCVSCFSGSRQHEFTDHLVTHPQLRNDTTNAEKSVFALTNLIRETTDKLLEKIIKFGPESISRLWAKVDWYSVEDIKDGKYGNKLENFVPKQTGRYFLDRSKRCEDYYV